MARLWSFTIVCGNVLAAQKRRTAAGSCWIAAPPGREMRTGGSSLLSHGMAKIAGGFGRSYAYE